MFKKFFIPSVLFLFTSVLAAQQEQIPNRFIDNVRFGGSVNMGFGSSHSFIMLAPSAIYDFSHAFSAGVSAKYMYFKRKSGVDHTTNMFGGSILSLVRPTPNIQLSAEFERLKLNKKIIIDPEGDIDKWQSALFIGAEYVTGNIAMGLRYDLLYDKVENVIYPSAITPVFRVYF